MRSDKRTRRALGELLQALKLHGYRFITPTPETHERVISRPERRSARDLNDVFGWNLPFPPGLVAPRLRALLADAGVLTEAGEELLRSMVRVAWLNGDLYLHSGFPPERESVFFGPDTYRFARFVTERVRTEHGVSVLVEVGAGAGAGAVTAARLASPKQVILTDINPTALKYAQINLDCAGVRAEFRCGRDLDPLTELADLIIANPPFIAGTDGRLYSDGGDRHGAQTSLQWAVAGAARLAPNGRMLLYTGTAIVDGVDRMLAALRQRLDGHEFDLDYSEIDPDIFSETLDLDPYRDVDRIAAVGAVITRRSS